MNTPYIAPETEIYTMSFSETLLGDTFTVTTGKNVNFVTEGFINSNDSKLWDDDTDDDLNGNAWDEL